MFVVLARDRHTQKHMGFGPYFSSAEATRDRLAMAEDFVSGDTDRMPIEVIEVKPYRVSERMVKGNAKVRA